MYEEQYGEYASDVSVYRVKASYAIMSLKICKYCI